MLLAFQESQCPDCCYRFPAGLWDQHGDDIAVPDYIQRSAEMMYVCVGIGIVTIAFLILFALGLCKVAADGDDQMGIR